MACEGHCIPKNFGVPDPTGKGREQVVNTAPMVKFGSRWCIGTKHWRCAGCLASRADTPKPLVPATTEERRPVEKKKPRAYGVWTLEDFQ